MTVGLSNQFQRRVYNFLYENDKNWFCAHDLKETKNVYKVGRFLAHLYRHGVLKRQKRNTCSYYQLNDPYWTIDHIENEVGWV